MINLELANDLLESIKSETVDLNNFIDNIKEFSTKNIPIPNDLCQITTVILQSIASHQEALNEQIQEIAEIGKFPETFADIEILLEKHSESAKLNALIDELLCVKSERPKAIALIGNLAESIRLADENQELYIQIARALIDDVKNNAMPYESSLLNIEEIEESPFFKLTYYFLRKALYFEAPVVEDTFEDEQDFAQEEVVENSVVEEIVTEEPIIEETVVEETPVVEDFVEEPEQEVTEDTIDTEEFAENSVETEIENNNNFNVEEEPIEKFEKDFEEKYQEKDEVVIEKSVTNNPPSSEDQAREDTEVEDIVYEEIIPDDSVEVSDNISLEYSNIEEKVADMILDDKVYCALTYLKAAASYNSAVRPLYVSASYAFDNPLERLTYDSNRIMATAESIGSHFERFFVASSTLRNFFYNDREYDFYVDALLQYVDVPEVPEVKKLAQTFGEFKKANKCGVEVFSECYIKEQLVVANQLREVMQEADDCYEKYFKTPFEDTTGIKRYVDTVKRIFNEDGNLAAALEIVYQNDKASMEMAEIYISSFMQHSDEISEKTISTDAVNNLIDDAWRKCCGEDKIHRNVPLVAEKREKVYIPVMRCLRAIAKYVRLSKTKNTSKDNPFKKQQPNVLSMIDVAIKKCDNNSHGYNQIENAGFVCLSNTLSELKSRLEGTCSIYNNRKFFFVDFAKTGNVTLEADLRGYYMPVLRDFCPDLKQLNILSRIYEHSKSAIPQGFNLDFENLENKNLMTMNIIRDYYFVNKMNTSDIDNAIENLLENSNNLLNSYELEKDNFIEFLELSQSYEKITFETKENLVIEIENIFRYAKQTKNYGFYKKCQEIIRHKVDTDAEHVSEELSQRLVNFGDMRSSEYVSFEILRKYENKISKYIDKKNYVVAKNIMDKISRGEINENTPVMGSDDMVNFQRKYNDVYNASSTSGELLSDKTIAFINNNTRVTKERRGGTFLLETWLNKRCDFTSVSALLTKLGIKSAAGATSEQVNDYFDCRFTGEVAEIKTDHIFEPFASGIKNNSFRVKCLFGENDSNSIINEIDSLSRFNKNTIIFVDYALNLDERRTLARKIKEKAYNEIYMVIDRVIVAYLAAGYQQDNVLKKLLNICMPFSYYQPYTDDFSQPITPEMFMGRENELEDVISISGPTILYGGKLLGKTELLKKAQREIDGVNNQVAIYLNIKNQNVENATETLTNELMQNGLVGRNDDLSSWDSMTESIKNRLIDKNIDYLLLLLDDGDTFVKDCSENYSNAPVKSLLNIMSDKEVNFKFVISGVEGVGNFYRKYCEEYQLTSLLLKPMSNANARKLLEEPLTSLGMYIPDDEKIDKAISDVFTKANYSPAFIQMFGAKLVESFKNQEIHKLYDDDKCPPYNLVAEHLEKVIDDGNLDVIANDMFNNTLEQNYIYKAIALLMAEWCDEENDAFGFTPDNVLNKGKDYEIAKISSLSSEEIKVYMDELVDNNILRKMNDTSYAFARQRYLKLLGSGKEVFEKICAISVE